jgi:hypothetical protein
MKSIKTYLFESIQSINLFENQLDNEIIDYIKKLMYRMTFTCNNYVFEKVFSNKILSSEIRKYIVKDINNFKQYFYSNYDSSVDYSLGNMRQLVSIYPEFKGLTYLKYLIYCSINSIKTNSNVTKEEVEKYYKIINNNINNIYKEIKLDIDKNLNTSKLPKNNSKYNGDTDDIDPVIESQLEKVISDELNSMLDGNTCYIPSYDNENDEEEVSWEEAIDSGYYSNIIDFLDAEFMDWREDIYKTLKSNKSLKLNGINKNDIMAVIERTAENMI